MRVVVMGCDGAGSRSHYITEYHGPDTPGTMVTCNIMRCRTHPITPQDHYTHASTA